MREILASKRKNFEVFLSKIHPKLARLAREIASRKSSATSMTDLAIAVVKAIQTNIEASELDPETLIHSVRNKAIEIADWAAATGNDWKNMSSLDELIQASEAWHEELANNSDKNATYIAEDETEMEFPDGWRVVKLNPENAYAEGDLMGHCIGTNHANDLADGSMIAFSLRDPQNRPHVTFSIKNRSLEEGSGRSDQISEEAYELVSQQRLEDWNRLMSPRSVKESGEQGRIDAHSALRLREIAPEQLEEKARTLAAEYVAENRNEYIEKWGEPNKYDQYGDENVFMEAVHREEDNLAMYSDQEDDWYVDQVQGKEDEPPRDKYRPYLRAVFKNNPDWGTSDVEGRVTPVADLIERTKQDPFKLTTLEDDARLDEVEPAFEHALDKVYSHIGDDGFLRDPAIDRSLLQYIESKIDKGVLTQQQDAVAREIFTDPNTTLYTLQRTGVLAKLKGGIDWLLKELSLPFWSTSDARRFSALITGLSTYSNVFADEGLRLAIARSVEKAFDDFMDPKHGYTQANNPHLEERQRELLKAYANIAGGETYNKVLPSDLGGRVFETLSRMINGVNAISSDPRFSIPSSGNIRGLLRWFDATDPQKIDDFIASLSPSVRENVGVGHLNLSPASIFSDFPGQGVPEPIDSDSGLFEDSEIPPWKHRRYEDKIQRVENIPQTSLENQLKLPEIESSKKAILKLAVSLEEEFPEISDRLESLL